MLGLDWAVGTPLPFGSQGVIEDKGIAVGEHRPLRREDAG